MSEAYADVESRITDACDNLRKSKKPNVARTAREFQVPLSHLRWRWKGRQTRVERPAGNKRLTEAEELAVCIYLKRLDTIGTCARLPMITSCANEILRKDDSVEHLLDPPPTVSELWSRRFLKLHPEFHIQKQKMLDQDRKNAHNPVQLLDWFERYRAVVEEKGIQARDIYNFDETGFRIGVGKDQWIVTLDPNHQSYLGSSTNRDLVTSCETISGDGEVLPPMLILPGKLHMEDWVTKTNLADDILLAVSETGYSNDVIALDWLSHFDRFSSRRQIGAYRLLLIDGHTSHCTREFITYCDERKIIPFCLPPHSTHLLQPLDVVVFLPLKHYHAEAIDQATRTGCSDFNKVEFLSAIGSIREQAFKPTTIISSFRKTGLIPYNPDKVLSRLHTSDLSTDNRPVTPIPIPADLDPPTTPQTVRALEEHAQYLQRVNSASPRFQASLARFSKGSLAQAHAGNQAFKDLENTRAAEQARSVRQTRSRRSTRNGGAIYAHESRAAIRKKAELGAQEKLEQAEREVERLQKVAIRDRKKIWKITLQRIRRLRTR